MLTIATYVLLSVITIVQGVIAYDHTRMNEQRKQDAANYYECMDYEAGQCVCDDESENDGDGYV